MFERDDQVYYASRAAHATSLGDRATDPNIAAIHYELALRYSILSVQAPRTQPHWLEYILAAPNFSLERLPARAEIGRRGIALSSA